MVRSARCQAPQTAALENARILVTGGAGFIGRHVVQALLARGHDVRVLDALVPQVHGDGDDGGHGLEGAELRLGDVRDRDAVRSALEGVDAVVHLAAEVGVGQSMYEIERYVGVNEFGTAVLLQALQERPVRRVVTASSMSVYGEGLYRDAAGHLVETARRGDAVRGWDPLGADGRPLTPVATPETKRVDLASVYALNKYQQERLTHLAAEVQGIEAVTLRLFNVYGRGQALSNPYTGVLAIFAARVLNGEPPVVFEDGRQRRDFVHVDDVARAVVAALERPEAAGATVNVASGTELSIADVAGRLLAVLGRDDLRPSITGKGRRGDVRHCFADIDKARRVLGFTPRVTFEAGLADLADWLARQRAVDRVPQAMHELERRGLVA
jgi:dTDP-L-rhamnose 4-epimerase